MKRCAFLLVMMLSVVSIRAQYVSAIQPQKYDKTLHWGGAFQHLDVTLRQPHHLVRTGVCVAVSPICLGLKRR